MDTYLEARRYGRMQEWLHSVKKYLEENDKIDVIGNSRPTEIVDRLANIGCNVTYKSFKDESGFTLYKMPEHRQIEFPPMSAKMRQELNDAIEAKSKIYVMRETTPEENKAVSEIEMIERSAKAKRNSKGYPLKEGASGDDDVDWELAGWEKEKTLNKYDGNAHDPNNYSERSGGSNRTPPKKKRKRIKRTHYSKVRKK